MDNVEKKQRVMSLIKRYNKSFTEKELDELILNGSVDYFYSSTNRLPENGIEKIDSGVINQFIEELRN